MTAALALFFEHQLRIEQGLSSFHVDLIILDLVLRVGAARANVNLRR